MSATFAAGAGRLAGLAGALLGWRPDHFWNATPAELGVVIEALAPAADHLGTSDLARLQEQFPDV